MKRPAAIKQYLKKFKSNFKIMTFLSRCKILFDKRKKGILLNRINFSLGLKKLDLLIYDDIYPHPVSGFRHEEFTILLTKFKNSKIILNPRSYKILNTPISEHKNHIREIIQLNKQLKGKLIYQEEGCLKAKLFYCVFINNIFANLEWLEKNKILFVFTLYPGGGFQVENEETNKKLKKVFDSPMFKKVIVTQQFTEDYLINKNLCKKENIKFIFGGVVPQQSLIKEVFNKKTYLVNKDTIDICFCAAKYMPEGKDKGYDVFINAAHNLSVKFSFIRFHVIGGFTEDDIDVSEFKNQIQFYGYQKFESLGAIYRNMDIIVSPNKPFLLGKGAFDGFPLGTVVEAVLNGVVALVSDELNQNYVFETSEELIIIKSNSNSIEKEIINLINKPENLYSISRKGREKFQQVYSNDIQMRPRIELLQSEILKA